MADTGRPRRNPRVEEWTMSAEGSVTLCLAMLKRGDRAAADELWGRYFHRLVGLARSRLRAAPRRSADEEDVALSAFDSFYRRAEAGQFPRLDDRDDLWQLLFVITVRKAIDLVEHQRRPSRGGGKVRTLSDLADFDVERLIGPEPTPDLAVELDEQCRRLLDRLGPSGLRDVALWKLEGVTNEEIAQKLGCVVQTVERKLRRIRVLWDERETTP
jgi:DNA-directed RNA polymerase specialized sigma24 family protein